MLIDDFNDPGGLSRLGTPWRSVTDQVMGGVSTARIAFEEIQGRLCLCLSGDVSLDNNGGFIQASLDLASEHRVGGPRSNQLHDASQGRRVLRLLGIGGKFAVEQDVASHAEHPMARAQAIADARRWWKLQSGAPIADHQGSDRDLQAVEKSGLREGGDGHATPLHEGKEEAPFPEDAKNRR